MAYLAFLRVRYVCVSCPLGISNFAVKQFTKDTKRLAPKNTKTVKHAYLNSRAMITIIHGYGKPFSSGLLVTISVN